jgi:hypothetical protein
MSGHRKPSYSRHRVDGTAKALEAEAKRLGLGVVPLGSAVDVALFMGATVRLVDWKGAGTPLTPSQAKLVASGAPIKFVGDVPQLQALAAEMRREALR